MASEKLRSFNLPYNQSPHYWLAVFAPSDDALQAALTNAGLKKSEDSFVCCLTHPWKQEWEKIRAILDKHKADGITEIALIAGGDVAPVSYDYANARKPLKALDLLVESLWLGDAMMEDRLVSYLQPVLDKRGKVFGYEAFARVETEKEVIAGGKIIEASRDLNVEYILDRHLHVKAITSFIGGDLEGFLFINFVPGFIHRPEKYLEGLTDAARLNGMPAKQIVLDLTRSETPHDLVHLKAIFDYCRSKGYSLSLDDIASTAMAKKILDTIRPDFIKLDIDLVHKVMNKGDYQTISELVQLAHHAGVTVIAEGVETKDMHTELQRAGVDLFQGYLFSPPVPVKKLKKATSKK